MYKRLEENPIIAAVRNGNEFEKAIESPVQVIFMLFGSVLNLQEYIDRAHAKDKMLFLHVDLTEGIGKDSAGIAWIAKMGMDGIISTRSNLMRYAREQGLFSVQRFFIVDSQSMVTAVENLSNSMPTMVELMPGVATKAIEHLCTCSNVPVIAGGLIQTKEEIIRAINAGATAISTVCEGLWEE